jgi:hypothetical protein
MLLPFPKNAILWIAWKEGLVSGGSGLRVILATSRRSATVSVWGADLGSGTERGTAGIC